ncbi:ParB/RepB/Spo0J family partition protein [Thermus caldilimi]|uniref:ParB/RepB/Spo0J family partition protein n=1 Tax=Thermus caldilimi TaxID=2483360 RepID=UPI0010766DEE|nr:ParB/RepB/Spo0J family partition protein [Thermus caldilimi]
MTVEVPLEKLELAPENPRQVLTEEGIAALADSIRQVGVLQNLVAYEEGGTYYVVGGGRRLRALWLLHEAGHDVPPVPVKVLPREEAAVVALVENLEREDLSPLEEAEGVARLADLLGVEEAAERLGRSPAYVALRQAIRDKLVSRGKEAFQKGQLTYRQIALLVRLPEEIQEEVLRHFGFHWEPDGVLRYLEGHKSQKGFLFTEEEYRQAGGVVVHDLEGNPHYVSRDVVYRLQLQHMTRLAEAAGVPIHVEDKPWHSRPVSPDPENIAATAKNLEAEGYKVYGLRWGYGGLELVYERSKAKSQDSDSLPATTRARLNLAKDLTHALDFVDNGNVRQAMAEVVLAALGEGKSRLQITAPSYSPLKSDEVLERWGALKKRLRELVDSYDGHLRDHPQLEQAFVLAVALALDQPAESIRKEVLRPEDLRGIPLETLATLLPRVPKDRKEAVAMVLSLDRIRL